MKFSLVLGLILVALATTNAQTDKVVCYWGSWSAGSGLPPSKIDTTICTHIIYSFIGVSTTGEITNVNDESIKNFVNMRVNNPRVKLMVAAGGDGSLSSNFSPLANSEQARMDFARNIVIFLQKHKFDGFDLDWEYPVVDSKGYDRENFIKLLTILKSQLSANNLIFSIAIAAGPWRSDQAYDIPRVQAQVDFINLMTYDLHGSWESFTGHNAPLSNDVLSVDRCLQHLISRGAPREKIILGVAAYGQLFSLTTNLNGFDAPAVGTGTSNYNVICQNNWQRVWSDLKQVPYKVSDNQWVGYDDVESISIKAKYSKDQRLGGVMIWALGNDDYANTCGQGTFPLTRAVSRIIMGNEVISSGPTIPISPPIPPTPTNPVGQAFTCPIANGLFADPTSASNFYNCGSNIANLMACGSAPTVAPTLAPTVAPTVAVTTPSVNQPFQCPSDGLFADPTNCSKYYNCGNGIAYSMPCNDGLKWNKVNQYCDHAYNVQC
ncbi:unnamed protein product [Diamesa hyperborea]